MKIGIAAAIIPATVILGTTAVAAAGHIGTPAAGVAPSASAASPSPAPVSWMSFQDTSANVAFAIQLQTRQVSSGDFQMTIAGVGAYRGTTNLSTAGKHVLHFSSSAPTQFTPLGSNSAHMVTVRLDGTVDTSRASASINIWTANLHYHLEDHPAAAGAAPGAAKAALDAIATKDWSTAYPLLASQVRDGMTAAQFASTMSAQPAPVIVSSTVSPSGQVTTQGGQTIWEGTATLLTGTGPGSHHYTVIIRLVAEGGVWHLLGTTRPVPY